jgi:hypothetical protein
MEAMVFLGAWGNHYIGQYRARHTFRFFWVGDEAAYVWGMVGASDSEVFFS